MNDFYFFQFKNTLRHYRNLRDGAPGASESASLIERLVFSVFLLLDAIREKTNIRGYCVSVIESVRSFWRDTIENYRNMEPEVKTELPTVADVKYEDASRERKSVAYQERFVSVGAEYWSKKEIEAKEWLKRKVHGRCADLVRAFSTSDKLFPFPKFAKNIGAGWMHRTAHSSRFVSSYLYRSNSMADAAPELRLDAKERVL